MTLSLLQCVKAAANNEEFVTNWMRLRGIALASSPIDRMIDEATGRNDAIAQQFIEDVHDLIYVPLEQEGA